ncbi:MAG: hypothetical protein E7Z89_01695 [Cyanobacteria bacterium SIG28]|nr:hypothetical protein [Cyanobacteria bacterium SIG28]
MNNRIIKIEIQEHRLVIKFPFFKLSFKIDNVPYNNVLKDLESYVIANNQLKKHICNLENDISSLRTQYFDFLCEDFLYKHFNPLKKRRLFITTGLISLINAMAIIKDLDNTNYQNFLIISSANISEDFKKYNEQLLLDNYFKSFAFVDYEIINSLSKHFNQFEEIYTTAQPVYNFWNNYSNINLIEEGISSYYSYEEINYANVQKIYLSNYFDKITYFDSDNIDKVVRLDKNIIKNVISDIRQKNNLDFKYLKKENQVLLLSQYVYQDIMSDDEVVMFYKKHIDKLIKNGYSVLFKSHPRVHDTITNRLVEIYKENSMFSFFPPEIKYPVELIIEDLDLKAIVTSASGGAINCSHLFDIPCYGFGANLIRQNHSFENVRRNAEVFINSVQSIKNM